MQAIDPDDPEFTTFDVSEGPLTEEGAFAIGSVKLPLKSRLKFLVTGRIEIAATTGGGTRFSVHTPRLRNLPLHLLAWVVRKDRS